MKFSKQVDYVLVSNPNGLENKILAVPVIATLPGANFDPHAFGRQTQ